MIYPTPQPAEPTTRRTHHDALDPIGRQISGRRRKLWLAQEDVAARAGVSRQALMRLERGDCGQTYTLVQVLDALGLELTVQEKS